VERISAAGFIPRGAAEIQTVLDARIVKALEAAAAFEIRAVALSAKSEVDILEDRLKARAADIAQRRRLLEGVAPAGSAEGTVAPTYPTRSLQLIAQTTRLLEALRKDVVDIGGRYSKEPPYVASAPAVVVQLERARALDGEAVRKIEEGAALAAAALERQRQAQSNRLEADRRLAEARAALNREDFDTARERLDRARERYLASLSFEEDAELRARSDRDLESLGGQIVRAENERVVRETRRLLTEGKTLYNQGEFARAEEALIQARARWKVTHTDEPEPEVEYWLRLVQTALSVKTGRDIPQTAPLYPEMSQLLSLAKKYFQEGKRPGKPATWSAPSSPFDRRRKSFRSEVVFSPCIRMPGPGTAHQPDLGSGRLNRGIRASLVERTRSKIDARKALETVYSDLLDLDAIDPKYPGLRSLIERLEIMIGLRLPPPDPKALAEARTLTAAAQKTFDSRDVSRFPTALAQLNRALELDPNNDNASRLKDRILTYVGGTATLVLPSAGETIFNEAVAFFQNGDYLSARIRLTRLYEAYPQARRSKGSRTWTRA
jgi:tetratricopeptide (TPR) repeat protein